MSTKSKAERDAEIAREKQKQAAIRRKIAQLEKADAEATRRERTHGLVLLGVSIQKATTAGDMDRAELAQLIAYHLDETDRPAALAALTEEGEA